MHDVFISYSTKDQKQAETVRSVLEHNGIPCWMAPRDIPGGSNYTKEIPLAIRGCQVFVLILSDNSQSSHWVLKELDSAVNCGKVILPFMLENCQLNDEFNFLLTGAQRYEAYRKKADALEELISRIRAITNAPSDASVPKAEPVPDPKQEENHTYLGLARCPACGGGDLEELVKKTGKFTFLEGILSFLPLISAVLCAIVTPILVAILLAILGVRSDSMTSAMAIGLFVGAIAGAFLGKSKARDVIRRQRLRRGLNPNPFRCTVCKKEFLIEKD